MKWHVVSAREAALRMLADNDSPEAGPPSSLPLAPFQQDAVMQASRILRHRGGVLIADSVGLGKTFIALALVEAALRVNQRVLLVIPAGLRRMWRLELRRVAAADGNICVLSHSALGLGRAPHFHPDLVVVDEAHAFRNPATRRYRALRRVCRSARVILLTATPVNNSMSDLYFQLRLFCSDGAFRDIGIGSLREAFRNPQGSDLDRLRRAVMVRRTRNAVRAALPESFRFPRHVHLTPVKYHLPMSVSAVAGLLGQLSFVAHRAGAERMLAADVMRFGLLKRLDSSAHAFRLTLRHLMRFYEQFIAALADNMVLHPRTFHSAYSRDDDSLQLLFDPLMLEPAPARIASTLRHEAESELTALRGFLLQLSNDDGKLTVLRSLLAARAKQKTLVFTEYRDTAAYLWRELRNRFAVGLIDGSGAWLGATPASRQMVVERFAPAANHVRTHDREGIQVLIATDVLAEGMNLQDADAVVSYDLPWNPVRLIQRAGRVDRMGSPHDVVNVYNFLPDHEFDELLGLAKRIRHKLETARAVVVQERPVLEPEELFEAIRSADAGVLDRIEPSLDPHPEAVHFPELDGVAIGRVGLARQKLMVNLRRHRESVMLLVDMHDGSWREDALEAGRLLQQADAESFANDVDYCEIATITERCMAEFAAQRETIALGPSSAASRVARLIKTRLSRLPLDDSADIYAHADGVLAKLGSALGVRVEDELESLLRNSWNSLAPLLTAAEKAFSQHEIPVPPHELWRVVAVLIAD